jgi:hypothetical protein
MNWEAVGLLIASILLAAVSITYILAYTFGWK